MCKTIIRKSIPSVLGDISNMDKPVSLFHGDALKLLKSIPDNSVDLIITSPPYCMGKEYEDDTDTDNFIENHRKVLPEIVRITKEGGSICWQVGIHVKDNSVTPLDFLIHNILSNQRDIYLRNRIVWTFGHGLHCSNRFSGRHETIMWYTKGKNYTFNLDAVRVPQKYPGKRYAKGPNKGELSSNPKGKNPSDVWEIPNVKANHIEKTDHPCQFPVAIAQRLIRALSNENDLVLDPYAGSSSTCIAAIQENRRFVGSEISDSYIKISEKRILNALGGVLKIRPLDREIHQPKPTDKVAIKPEHFWQEIMEMVEQP